MRACPYNIIIIIILNNLFAIMGRTRFFGLVACLPWVYSAHTTYRPTVRRRCTIIILQLRRRRINSNRHLQSWHAVGTESRRRFTDNNIMRIVDGFSSLYLRLSIIGATGRTRVQEYRRLSSPALNFNSHDIIEILRDIIIPKIR